ncbi:MAG TPA: nucleotidyltransferase domain-containing protein [Candidatus Wallbacteria bacterium]|nr:nucleotidyltransferase domain-containing protein [Candidatus Wallbacteria bacterium]
MADRPDLKDILKIVEKYAELLKENMDVKGVYLFGSFVRGGFDEDSDIDVAVVSDEFNSDLVDDTLKLMRLRRKVDNRIEPHPFLLKDFNENNPFVKELMSNNIKVA